MSLSFKQKLNYWLESLGLVSILIFVTLFPFNQKLSVAVVLFYFLVTIIGRTRKPVPLKFIPVTLWASVTFYLLHVVSLLYSENLQYGFRDLETKMGLLLFPVAAVFFPRTAKEISLFHVSFVCISALAVITCGVHSTVEFISTGDISSFYYDSFSFLMHPTYFTMMLNFALLLLLDPSKEVPVKFPVKSWLYFSVFVLLIAGVIFSSSRAGIVITLITCLLFILFNFRENYKDSILKLLFILIASGIIFSVSVMANPASRFGILTREAFGVEQPKNLDQKEVDTKPLSHRLQLWEIAWEQCIKYPFGTGSGDVIDLLVVEYSHAGFEKAKIMKYNPHNQYLQSWLAIGLPGIISLLLILFPFYKFRKSISENKTYYFLALIIAINGLFESVFEVQRGIILFSFIIMFFGINYNIINKPGVPVLK